MGKFLLTNKKNWSDELRRCFIRSGFKEFSNISEKEYFTVYKKLKVNTYNFYQKDDNYVGCAGTFVYKEEIGEKALKFLFEDIKDGFNLNKIRENAFGSYVVVIKQDSKIFVFVDEYHTYAVYYYLHNDDYLLTNNFYHIENIIKSVLNGLNLIEYVAQFSIVDNKTPYENIYKLMGDEYLLLDLANNENKLVKTKLNNKENKNYSSLEDAENDLRNGIIYYSQIRKKLFPKATIFMTGGVDSRLILASYLNVGQKPRLCRWHGGNQILNSKVEDFIISRKIAKGVGLSFKNYNTAEDFKQRYYNTNRDDYDKLGEMVSKYGNNGLWHKIYDKINSDFVDFGYFGELLVDWDKLDKYADFSKPFTLQEFIMQVYVNKFVINDIIEKENYIKLLYDKFELIAKSRNLDCNNLSKEDCMWLFFNYRLHADTHMVNITNMYYYYFPILCQKEVSEVAHCIPYNLKQSHKLNLLLTKNLYQDLIKYEYFSHCRYRTTDMENLALRELDDGVKHKKSLWLKLILRLNRLNKKNYVIFKEDQYIKDFCIREMKIFLNEIGLNINETTFNYLPIYTTFLLMTKMHEIMFKDKTKTKSIETLAP